MGLLLNQKLGGLLGAVTARVPYTAFTQVGGTATLARHTIGAQIPVGAHYLGSIVNVVTGFTGDTSAVITIGDGTDVDRYNTSTVDVSSAGFVSAGAPSGVPGHGTAKSPVISLTTGADTDNVSTGVVEVQLVYLNYQGG